MATNLPAWLTNTVSVSAGYGFGVALLDDGTVRAWGTNYPGVTNVTAGLSNVVAVAAAGAHTIALRADGSVVGWGASGDSAATVPKNVTNVVAIAAGRYSNLAVRDNGTVIAWGTLPGGALPRMKPVVAVAAGSAHSMALTSDGEVVVWGNNAAGQTNVPPGLSNVVAIASGEMFCLALKSDGTVVAWGAGNKGQTNLPAGLKDVVAISAGTQHALATLADGTVVAWGDSAKGQSKIPTGLSSVASVAGGDVFSLAVTGPAAPFMTTPLLSRSVLLGRSTTFSTKVTGSAPVSYRWTHNDTPVPGASDAVLRLDPVQLEDAGSYSLLASNALGVVSVSAGLLVTQVGLYGTNALLTPAGFGVIDAPLGLTNIGALAAGKAHIVGLRQDGTVLSWGGPTQAIVQVPEGLSNVVQVSAGNAYSLALHRSGEVTAWGTGKPAQPQNIPALHNIRAIAGGFDHALALAADGTVTAWGDNSFGQTNVPPGLTNVVEIAASFSHSVALRADGKLMVWGGNVSWVRDVPIDATNLVAIAGSVGFSVSHTLGLRADGSLVAWGYPAPAIYLPPGLSNIVSMAPSYSGNAVSFSDGRVLAWGDNLSGQTNLPPDLSGATAVTAAETATAVLIGAGAPFITTPLADRTVGAGSRVVVRVHANGARPLAYQWRFKGADLAGQTNSILELDSSGLAESGAYSVVVSNSQGNTLSPDMQIRVAPLLLLDSPQGVSTLVGSGAVFTVGVAGEDLHYQWQLNGADIPGATNSRLELNRLSLGQAGSYRVIVSSGSSSVTSAEALLRIEQTAAWGTQPATQTLPLGMTNLIGIAAGLEKTWGITLDHVLVPLNQTSVIGMSLHDAGLILREDGTVIAVGADGQSVEVPTGLTNVVSVAQGDAHALALTADGRVIAWGDNTYGQTNVPPDLPSAVAIGAGAEHSLALSADGTLRVWGGNQYGQLNTPADLTNITAIAARGYHSVALRQDGSVVSWGGHFNSYIVVDVVPPPPLTNAIAVAAGSGHDLALTADSNVLAWGANFRGQTNLPPGIDGNIVAISAGAYHSVVLASDLPPVLGAPSLESTVEAGSRFTLKIASEINRVYRLEYQDSLADTLWKPLGLVAGTGGTLTLVDPAPRSAARFYRVRRW